MLLARFGKVTFTLFALWLCIAARPAQAQVDLVNNLSNTTSYVDRIGGTLWEAASFKTDNRTYTLSSATLKLSSLSNGVVTVDLFSNTGSNKPGASLISLGNSNPLDSTLADITFTPAGGQILLPNTVYWVVAHSLNSAEWGATASTAYTGFGTIPSGFAFAASADSGSTWTAHPIADGPNQFRVRATTPEPGLLALTAGLGLAGVSTLRRRRKS